METIIVTDTLNIVKQAPQSCRGEHVDPEYTFFNGYWEKSDNRYDGPIVETLYRSESETDEQFSSVPTIVHRRLIDRITATSATRNSVFPHQST